MTIATGTHLGRYKIVSKIGAGGMGEVYLAEDTKLERKTALKILPEDLAKDADRMQRFVREAKSASALNHPNIITIYEIGEADNKHFIAAEYIEGETLHSRLKTQPLNIKAALDIAIQVASALDAAHRAGIIHRDIKPENVMIRPDGFVKLLDFGIAKLTEKQGEINSDSEAATAIKAHTTPGMIIGTANYMSPEQARGKEIDVRSDIFSFGVMLYQMLAGKLPFEGENALEMIGAILKDEPKPLDSDVPTEITKIIGKCLRKDRDERYQTIKDVLIDLKDVKQDLEFQNKLERTNSPDKEEPKTQILPATTVDETNQTATNQTAASHPTKKYLAIALAILLISAIGFFGYRSFAPNKQIESIAVMPFVNESGNADVEYLSDGMTEMLISSLSNLPNLNVKPRSSVFRYKGKETDPQTIGKELNVQAILNGRVVQRGQDISLFVELIDISLDKVIWSQQYNRKQSDLVTLQTEIARDVSSKLKSKLSGADVAKVEKTYTTNPEAYQLYLKGNFYRTKYTEEGYKKGVEYYQQAIALDPNYALAYSGIAYAYITSSEWYLPPNVAMPKTKAAALKALELDNTLAEPYAHLGNVAFFYEYDWAETERLLKRAIELNPNYSNAHHFYGFYLIGMGRKDEAIKEMKLAQSLEPLDLQNNSSLAYIYLFAGRYDDSIAQSRKTIEIDQNFWQAHLILGLAYERKKQFPEAIAALEKAHSLDDNPWITGYLGYVYAAAVKKEEARKLIGELKEFSKQHFLSALYIAYIYAGLNEKDQAFEWLDKAYEQHSGLALVNVETTFDNLRPDPRYKDLLKRMNLPE
ncbi:MAG: protein kinase domain-containing protein [Pyrinomonadaceae bacterium]